MAEKNFRLSSSEIKALIPLGQSCVASDKITVEGSPVGYMYRESPSFDTDSGWRFFSGTESQDYVDNPDNMMLYDLNTIANYDNSIITYLEWEFGSELEKGNDGKFKLLK